MPSNRMGTILEEIEKIILEAAANDDTFVALPEGFFGKGSEQQIIYNAKHPPLFKFAKTELEKQGFKIGKTKDNKQLIISW